MHKIKKGIKKKVKGKKNKDSELFTPEEYERYKKQKEEEARHLQEQTQEDQLHEDHATEDLSEEEPVEDHHHHQEEVTAESAGESSTGNEKKEDWRNFFSATDTVLKKTSENLEHIKESSYFQAKKAAAEVVEEKETPVEASSVSSAAAGPPSSKRWVDLDKGGIDDTLEEGENEETEEGRENQENSFPEEQEEKPVVKELHYIEDLPIVAAEDFADVFDTTYVDTVESGEIQLYHIPDSPTEENLNEPDPFDTSNVEKVLHIEKEEPPKPKEKEQLPAKVEPQKKKKKNLVNLGCAVEVLTRKEPLPDLKKKEVNLLADFEDEEDQNKETESKPSPEEHEKQEEVNEEKCALDDILFGDEPTGDLPEFVVPPKSAEELQKKEEATNKEESKVKETHEGLPDDLAELLDPLAATDDTVAEKESHLKDLVAEFDLIDKVESVPKPIVVKSEAIDDNIKDEIDAEFAALAAESLAKEKEKEIDEIGVLDDDDPFDTSAVKEVLGESETQEVSLKTEDQTESFNNEKDPFDVDFAESFIKDQQKVKKKPPRPSAPKSNPVTLLDDDPFDTSAATKVLPSDLLEAVDDISLPETLQPQSSEPRSDEPDNFDPFDTSVAESFGKTELKVLEGELLSDISQKPESDSDFDFNPREEESKKPPLRPPSPACLLTTVTENPDAPVLAPQALVCEEEQIDPFDTSFAEKVNIKSLEEELLSDTNHNPAVGKKSKPPPRPVSPSCLLATLQSESNSLTQISSIAKKALAEDFDPFDTSIADTVDPLDKREDSFSRQNSRKKLELDLKPPRPVSPVCLLATTPLDEHPTLEPVAQPVSKTEEDFDPFDTSIAEQFGKTELKVLETELLTKGEIQDDFDPRASEEKSKKHPPPRPVSPACLLTSGAHEEEQQLPPLSPLAANEFPSTEDIDPFDTSIANQANQFGKAEIKRLESELLTGLNNKEKNLSPNTENKPLRPPPPTPCAFTTTPVDNNPSLQPFSAEPNCKEATTAEEIDPFDTSIANHLGKAEIKSLEETLLTKEVENPDKIFHLPSSVSTIPVLHPAEKSDQAEPETQEVDPFDTSIAAKFGQTELKVLETELLDSGTKRNLSDDEFDPREEESRAAKRQTPSKDIHNILDKDEDLPVPPLAPQPVASLPEPEIDPFDTSIAENIGPSQEELKIIGKELLD